MKIYCVTSSDNDAINDAGRLEVFDMMHDKPVLFLSLDEAKSFAVDEIQSEYELEDEGEDLPADLEDPQWDESAVDGHLVMSWSNDEDGFVIMIKELEVV